MAPQPPPPPTIITTNDDDVNNDTRSVAAVSTTNATYSSASGVSSGMQLKVQLQTPVKSNNVITTSVNTENSSSKAKISPSQNRPLAHHSPQQHRISIDPNPTITADNFDEHYQVVCTSPAHAFFRYRPPRTPSEQRRHNRQKYAAILARRVSRRRRRPESNTSNSDGVRFRDGKQAKFSSRDADENDECLEYVRLDRIVPNYLSRPTILFPSREHNPTACSGPISPHLDINADFLALLQSQQIKCARPGTDLVDDGNAASNHCGICQWCRVEQHLNRIFEWFGQVNSFVRLRTVLVLLPQLTSIELGWLIELLRPFVLTKSYAHAKCQNLTSSSITMSFCTDSFFDENTPSEVKCEVEQQISSLKQLMPQLHTWCKQKIFLDLFPLFGSCPIPQQATAFSTIMKRAVELSNGKHAEQQKNDAEALQAVANETSADPAFFNSRNKTPQQFIDESDVDRQSFDSDDYSEQLDLLRTCGRQYGKIPQPVIVTRIKPNDDAKPGTRSRPQTAPPVSPSVAIDAIPASLSRSPSKKIKSQSVTNINAGGQQSDVNATSESQQQNQQRNSSTGNGIIYTFTNNDKSRSSNKKYACALGDNIRASPDTEQLSSHKALNKFDLIRFLPINLTKRVFKFLHAHGSSIAAAQPPPGATTNKTYRAGGMRTPVSGFDHLSQVSCYWAHLVQEMKQDRLYEAERQRKLVAFTEKYVAIQQQQNKKLNPNLKQEVNIMLPTTAPQRLEQRTFEERNILCSQHETRPVIECPDKSRLIGVDTQANALVYIWDRRVFWTRCNERLVSPQHHRQPSATALLGLASAANERHLSATSSTIASPAVLQMPSTIHAVRTSSSAIPQSSVLPLPERPVVVSGTRPLIQLPASLSARCMAIIVHRNVIIIGFGDKIVRCFTVSGGALVAEYHGHQEAVECIAVRQPPPSSSGAIAGGDSFVTGSRDGYAIIWPTAPVSGSGTVSPGEPQRYNFTEAPQHYMHVDHQQILTDRVHGWQRVSAARRQGKLKTTARAGSAKKDRKNNIDSDIEDNNDTNETTAHYVGAVALAHALLVTGINSGEIFVFSVGNNSSRKQQNNLSGPLYKIHPNNAPRVQPPNMFHSEESDDLNSAPLKLFLIKTLHEGGHSKSVGKLIVCRDSQFLCSSSASERHAVLWYVRGDSKLRYPRKLYQHPREVSDVDFLYLRVVTACVDGRVRLWSAVTGQLIRVLSLRANSNHNPFPGITVTPAKTPTQPGSTSTATSPTPQPPILQLAVMYDGAKLIVSSTSSVSVLDFATTVDDVDDSDMKSDEVLAGKAETYGKSAKTETTPVYDDKRLFTALMQAFYKNENDATTNNQTDKRNQRVKPTLNKIKGRSQRASIPTSPKIRSRQPMANAEAKVVLCCGDSDKPMIKQKDKSKTLLEIAETIQHIDEKNEIFTEQNNIMHDWERRVRKIMKQVSSSSASSSEENDVISKHKSARRRRLRSHSRPQVTEESPPISALKTVQTPTGIRAARTTMTPTRRGRPKRNTESQILADLLPKQRRRIIDCCKNDKKVNRKPGTTDETERLPLLTTGETMRAGADIALKNLHHWARQIVAEQATPNFDFMPPLPRAGGKPPPNKSMNKKSTIINKNVGQNGETKPLISKSENLDTQQEISRYGGRNGYKKPISHKIESASTFRLKTAKQEDACGIIIEVPQIVA